MSNATQQNIRTRLFVAMVQQHCCKRIITKTIARRAAAQLDITSALDAIIIK